MKQPELPKAILIDTQDALDDLAHVLRNEPLLGIDTESNSLYVYYERVCLIQISTRAQDYLVDPLALDCLGPLAPVMADSRIEKIFHAAAYDIASLKRDFDWTFSNLFDTMEAARILGWRQVGLGNVLEQEFNVEVDKRFQRANWGQRPLPKDRLQYAQMDTHYLPALRDRMAAKLKNSGHWEEALEIFSDIVRAPAAEHSFDPEGFWRIGKSHGIPRDRIAEVRELYLLRDKIARRKNQPPFKIFSDKTLAALVHATPCT
ncbi:MAG: ribonuclease D, partial [Anaerolineae bacterium]|nr:ribonuclease D [Anaerolineae bacterium]